MPDDEFRKIKALAALRGQKLKDVILDAIRSGLAQPAGERRRVELPLIRGAGRTITLEDVKRANAEMDEEEDRKNAGLG